MVESSFQKGGGEGVCFNFLTLWPAVHWQRRQEGYSVKLRLRAYGGANWVAPPPWGRKRPWRLGLTCIKVPGISCLAPQLGSTGIHTSTGCVWHTHAGGWFPLSLTPILCVPPQDAAHHRATAAPPGVGEDGVPFVCCVRAPSHPALLPLPSAAAVPEALLGFLYHLPPTTLLPPATPAQLAAGPPGHGGCGWAGGPGGPGQVQVFSKDDGTAGFPYPLKNLAGAMNRPILQDLSETEVQRGQAVYPRSHSFDEAKLTLRFSL